MQTSYIYSVSRANTLRQFLLTKSEIERLLVAKAGADLQSALKETYLAPYVTHVESGDVSEAIEETLIEAKRTVHQIAPNGHMFTFLWVQYDIHNLRVYAKARANNLSFEECAAFVSRRGVYDPKYLFTVTEKSELDFYQSGWQAAFDQAVKLVAEGKLDAIDTLFDDAYFATSQAIVEKSGDQFVQTYFTI